MHLLVLFCHGCFIFFCISFLFSIIKLIFSTLYSYARSFLPEKYIDNDEYEDEYEYDEY